MTRKYLMVALALAVGAFLVNEKLAADEQVTPGATLTQEQMAASGLPVHVTWTADQIQWQDVPPTLPRGAKIAVLEGDPKKEGFFAMRIKAPAGYKIPPHFHPVQERVTVVAGDFFLGQGDVFDEKALTKYPAGSYISMPAGMRHFGAFKKGGVIQLASIGPWGITYVNPADDPRNKKAEK